MRCLFPEDIRLASVHTQPTRLVSQFPDVKTAFQQATIPTTVFRWSVGRSRGRGNIETNGSNLLYLARCSTVV
jgi:hypothetical protein